jgi:hypothetical protein
MRDILAKITPPVTDEELYLLKKTVLDANILLDELDGGGQGLLARQRLERSMLALWAMERQPDEH